MNDHALLWYVFCPLIAIVVLLYHGLSALSHRLETIYNRLTGIHNELEGIGNSLRTPGEFGREFLKHMAAGKKGE